MTDLSTVKEEQIVLVDKDTAIRYKVIEEKIDLEALRREKEEIEARLAMKEPDEKELAEWGRMSHPYYMDNKLIMETRIAEIENLLRT
jgi:hypothetical protein